jgi:hypothetical protein
MLCFSSAQTECGHLANPQPAWHSYRQEPVAVRSYPALFELQRHYEAIRVWSYTTFIVIEASGQQETSGQNLKDLDKLIIIMIYTKHNH